MPFPGRTNGATTALPLWVFCGLVVLSQVGLVSAVNMTDGMNGLVLGLFPQPLVAGEDGVEGQQQLPFEGCGKVKAFTHPLLELGPGLWLRSVGSDPLRLQCPPTRWRLGHIRCA